MNSLKLIGILLLAIFMSPGTFAHCKGKHENYAPHCDGGGGGDSGGTDEAIFHVDIDGVLTGDQDSRPQSVKTGSKSVIFSPRQGSPMDFGLSDFWERTYAGGSEGSACFGHLIGEGTFVNGSLHLNESEGSQIGIVAFWFRGYGDDAATEIKYVIEFHDLNDTGWDTNEFPPLVGSDPLVLYPDSWEMRTEGKGELKKGPCVATGTFSHVLGDTVAFYLTRIN